jgi:hypothetical protein
MPTMPHVYTWLCTSSECHVRVVSPLVQHMHHWAQSTRNSWLRVLYHGSNEQNERKKQQWPFLHRIFGWTGGLDGLVGLSPSMVRLVWILCTMFSVECKQCTNFTGTDEGCACVRTIECSKMVRTIAKRRYFLNLNFIERLMNGHHNKYLTVRIEFDGTTARKLLHTVFSMSHKRRRLQNQTLLHQQVQYAIKQLRSIRVLPLC